MNSNKQQPSKIIRTPDQRLRVFVSSTLKELSGERVAAREAITRLHLAPVMFELGARPHLARDLYRAYLEQSHIFIGIYGEQYGWIAPNMSISGLEEEYLLAKNKPKLIYIKKPAPNRDPKLTEMLTKIRDRDGISYKYFSSTRELEELIEADLALMLAEVFEASQISDSTAGFGAIPFIPVPPTPLIGREKEIQSATELILQKDVRLLTFTGPGGSGKTRLSLEIAHRLSGNFAWAAFIELASISDAGLVADAIAHALNIREVGARSAEESLIDFFRNENVLLILDNFEQVHTAAPFVTKLLLNCAGLKILVTSRMALQIRGEREFPVEPLAVPEMSPSMGIHLLSEYPSVQLFVQRAQAVKPDFSMNESNARTIVEICRRLDGLPLAIELAAVRIRLMSPLKILQRLEQRLPLLRGGVRDLPERQQTIYNTIAWSYDLLAPREAKLFRRMAVFAGGSLPEAVDEVCNENQDICEDILEALEGLVSKNLVRSRETAGGDIRLEMLETIREFAFEKLEENRETAGMLEKHAIYYTQLGEFAEPYLRSGQRDAWLVKLEVEIDNIRQVLQRSIARQVNPHYGIRLAGTLGWFWHLSGYLTEGRNFATTLMNLPEAGGRTRERAKVLFPAGGLAWSQGDYTTANTILAESADIFLEAGDLSGLTDARGILAGGLASLGEYDRALEICRDTEQRLRQSGDRWGLAFTLLWLGSTLLVKTGKVEIARQKFEEVLNLSEELADPWIRAEAMHHLGDVTGLQGEHDRAIYYFEESLTFHEAFGDQWAIARGLAGYGEVMFRKRDLQKAKALFQRSLAIWKEMNHRLGILTCLAGLAEIALEDGDATRAAVLCGAAPRRIHTIGYLFLHSDSAEYQKKLQQIRKSSGESKWQSESEKGRRMSIEQAVDFALNEI